MNKQHYQKNYPAQTYDNRAQSPEASSGILPCDAYITCARHIQTWLNISTAREQRRFLEQHADLLDEHCEAPLSDLLEQAAEPAQISQWKETVLLWRDARRRGGTPEAIRSAYVNRHGGFVLDPPSWLETIEQRLDNLLNDIHLEETAEERVSLLQETLEQAQGQDLPGAELLATLHYELANAWRLHARTDRAQALETALRLLKEALVVFTVTSYPYQYAKTQNMLGIVYKDRILGEPRENLEEAITCYQQALPVYTYETFPVDYARVQNNLGNVYRRLMRGEQRENIEQAIHCYQEALRIYTLEEFPSYYAATHYNLGNAYKMRIAGEQGENIELALACYQETLRVHTLAAHPFRYAATRRDAGGAYLKRIRGTRRENIELALACYQETLRIHTLERFPFWYAGAQTNLATAYEQRLAGEPQENLEQAIACLRETLRIHTFDDFPYDYAKAQHNLGAVYLKRLAGTREQNLEQAIACFQEALRVFNTIDTFTREARVVYLSLADAEAERRNWKAAQHAYTTALEAEDLLVILGAGILGRDAILQEGGNAALNAGYALYQAGRSGEAAVSVERGRARGLAEALALDAADPLLITNAERRSRYTLARATLIATQADLHTSLAPNLDEHTRLRLELERTTAYRQARASFDTLVTEIRTSHDPDDFLDASLDETTILQAATRIGPGHVLVYLVATPWGGVAIAAFGEHGLIPARFATLHLPDLTEKFVHELSETRLEVGSECITGGFTLAQRGEGFEHLCALWDGETFQAKEEAFHAVCGQRQQHSLLDRAAREALACAPFAALAKLPLAELDCDERGLLQATFDACFLKVELQNCQEQLATVVLHPLIAWLQAEKATSLTLIPCGHLSAFPLPAIMLPDGRTVGEILPTSVAPSARALLQRVNTRTSQDGMALLGNPHDNLPWSEAEALTLKALAEHSLLPVEVYLKHQATRERLLTALNKRWVVNACCHGTFDTHHFLQSGLHLAEGEHITMSEMLNHHADLRGLRLILLSACQTALLDMQGARDEGHSFAAAMVQAGAQAVLAAQWAVDDKATYLLMVRFAQEWLPAMEQIAPAMALARAQAWLRQVTNKELAFWRRTMPAMTQHRNLKHNTVPDATIHWRQMPVRGRSTRYNASDAQLIVRFGAENDDPSAQPYADPYYWAGFQVLGW